jgi:hypothetical protein
MPDTMDLLERAKATRTRAAEMRQAASALKRPLDRLLALEDAVTLDRQAAALETRAAEEVALPPAVRN